ncbi:hypothetical protein GCM10027277_22440 [Pseudoduganella ginsengisoli]|uniref:Gluconate 2-dehydrogenase subunit 3 family protein n=1 Tax=Pseudoduganella ginsengisoli TaxID=1462440 RepID=A0A6L6PU01_9BURK|nr:gluconate 2-dehydrogenase subunit 3 family protein [Pseudoduganella ginsengisoli]MTW00498.1 hypothetical protein [Pseudoduganella ginsengisoli]
MAIVNFVDTGVLSAEQDQMLRVVLDMIIPASDDGRLPSAADVNFFAYVRNNGARAWLQQGLDSIAEECHAAHGVAFAVLDREQQGQLIEKLKRKLFRFFGELGSQVVQCYYQDDRVMAAIGMDPRSPFPLGYFPIDGDLAMLEPVFERGQIYRDCTPTP